MLPTKATLGTALFALFYVVTLLFLIPINAKEKISYRLDLLKDHNALVEFMNESCQKYPQLSLSLSVVFFPPTEFWSENINQCEKDKIGEFNTLRVPIKLPQDLFTESEMKWLLEAYRLIQQGTHTYMGEWVSPKTPQEISFLHSAFAKYPYVTARMMASAPAPHVGDVWRNLYQHMDRVLLSSTSLDDKRLLAFAMARDGRDKDALELIAELLAIGDKKSLNLMPLVSLDSPKEINDDTSEMNEPELGYKALSILENYLYRQNYPQEFCVWAHQTQGQLAMYVSMLLNNMQENINCNVDIKL
ncbi:hypothetical protein ACN9JF_08040 [Pseudoalteromonas lipolytica]|uniref:hypothetical protein n=1 Tax=Pseudoalteromonas lipolytica TaxID=570156 RepID=UPI003BA007F8